VKFPTKIQDDTNHGKNNKFVDFVVIFVNIFHGMEIIFMNIGVKEIE
jgi:hypothetical protein